MKRTDANLVILTGAGISAESGLDTFRAVDGLWENHRVEDVASPEGFARDPALVHRFYNARRAQFDAVEPNAAHVALAELQAGWGGEFLLVTQNIDDLHERAGSKRLIHMHGQGRKGWCTACDARFAWTKDMFPRSVRAEPVEALPLTGVEERQSFDKLRTNGCPGDIREPELRTNGSVCPSCGVAGKVRPDIVWFGEMPYQMDAIEAALMDCDLFVSVGTSGAVYPAAGFAQTANYRGAHTVEINLEPSQGSLLFDERRYGLASVEVPKWVSELLT